MLLISLVFFSSLPSPSLAATAHRCHPDDYKALMRIKDLGNPYDAISWETNTDCCDWNNLGCGEITNRVEFIDFSRADLSGQIPSSVADLPYLLSLIIRKNPNITGTIPSSILKLKRLTSLWMDWNSLSGPIPNFINSPVPSLRLYRISNYSELSFLAETNSPVQSQNHLGNSIVLPISI